MSRFNHLNNFKDVKEIIKTEMPGFTNEKLIDLINENRVNGKNTKALLVGEVQSGKTRNIIEFIKSTFIENSKSIFDLIIVFGGTTTKLNEQTKSRLEKNDESGLGLVEIIKFKDFSSLYSEKKDADKTVIYVGLKSNTELENILNTLSNIPNLKDKRILIIDDESDFGSINTKELGNASKYSEIIEEIYSIISNGSVLLSVTATPYANLMNHKISPYDYVLTLPCKDKYGYKGISFFATYKNFYLNIDDEKTWEISNLYYNEKWKKLYYVFSIYIINSLVKLHINKNGFENDKSDLLINVVYDKKGHKEIIEIMQDIIKYSVNGLPSFIKHLNEVNTKNVSIDKEKVSAILNSLNIIESNSDRSSEAVSDYNIYVGGVLLSRGITYKYLTVEYITNFPKSKISVDTMLQMCRWFGYRQYLDEYEYMNVITNKTGIKALKEIEAFNKIFYAYDKKDDGGVKDFAEIKNGIKTLEKDASYVVSCSTAKR